MRQENFITKFTALIHFGDLKKTEKMLKKTGREEGLNQTLLDGAGALHSKLGKRNRRMGGFQCLTENICGP